MKRSRSARFPLSKWMGWGLLVVGAQSGTLLSLRAEIAAKPPGISFLVPEEKLWLGRTQVIPFTGIPGKQKRIFEVHVDPPSALEILQAPTLLDGEKIGYLRVRPVAEGAATIWIDHASLKIAVATDATGGVSRLDVPTVVSPADGSHAWGKIAVGVALPVHSPDTWRSEVTLRLPDGTELSPVSTERSGANRNFGFEVDADSFPTGAVRLVAVARDMAGHEKISAATQVVVTRPDPSLMVAGSCSQQLSGERPERFGEKPPTVVKDANAPDGAYVNSNPAWCLPMEVKIPGFYQMMMTARGTFAAGAFPSIGLVVDGQTKPSTEVRLTDRDWRRVPLGQPVYLTPGSHVLTPVFLNAFYGSGEANRNLNLARYEVVRVESNGEAGTDTSATMMQDDPTEAMMSPQMDAAAAPLELGSPLATEDPLRVAFKEIFDGSLIAGPVTLHAVARTGAAAHAPRVELLINGKSQQVQQGKDLAFHIPVNDFRQGDNTLGLRGTLPDGFVAVAPVQHLIMPEKPQAGDQRRMLRYTVQDEAWDPSMKQRIERKGEESTAAFLTNGESFLNLPDGLAGQFRLGLEAKGTEFQGAPVAEVVLREKGHAEQVIARVDVHQIPGYVDAKTVQLHSGPKQLVIRFVNDLYEAKDVAKNQPGGDRNFFLGAVNLAEVEKNLKSVAPPEVRITYPTDPGHPVGGADVVVAQFFSGVECQSVDLIVDGAPQQLGYRPAGGMGPVVLPLLARNLSPGPHAMQVVGIDAFKRESRSPVFNFVVGKPGEVVNGPYLRALRLLNRFAYGAEPGELADVLTLGEKPWLQKRVNETFESPAEQSALNLARTLVPNDQDDGSVVPRVLDQVLASANPVRARFLLWVENHFSTWIKKAGAQNQWAQHLQFAEIGVAPFGDLLMASATSPAMLVYLDQKESFSTKLNENYAREIMELHTLGVDGGYNQQDVTSLARELNGWTVADEADPAGNNPNLLGSFRFEPALNDGHARRIFGMEFPATSSDERYDSVLKALEMLAAHPSAAHFISRKLAEQYVGDPAPPRLVADLSRVYLQTGGDLRAMIMAIADHPDFWSAPPRVATPLDFSLRMCRVTGAQNSAAVNDFLNHSGMGLYERPSPDGYPEADNNYVNSNTLMQRWRFSHAVQGNLDRLVPTAWAPSKRYGLDRAQVQRLIDLVSVRLIGEPLGPPSNEAAMTYFAAASAKDPDAVKLVTGFVAQTPELSLR